MKKIQEIPLQILIWVYIYLYFAIVNVSGKECMNLPYLYVLLYLCSNNIVATSPQIPQFLWTYVK